MNQKKLRLQLPWTLITLFFLVSAGVLVFGLFYIRSQRTNILNSGMSELSSISDLKTGQINQLRLARLREARYLSEDYLLIRKLKELLKNPQNTSLRAELSESFRSLASNFNYKNIFLLDSRGTQNLSWPEKDTIIGKYLRSRLPEVLTARKGILTDLHIDSQVGFVNLNLVLPLIDRSTADSTIFGMLSLRIDPREQLYPLVRSWPTSAKSGESYLVRKEGNEILYLNELRQQQNPALNFRKPVTDAFLPEAMALNGATSTSDGIDYRGAKVVASMKKVPGTGWYMISKIDRDEIFSSLESRMAMGIIIMALLILATGAVLVIFWRNQKVRYYRDQLEVEKTRQALSKHYEYILKYAHDIIMLVDKDLNILDVNDRALEVYQYTRDEMTGLNARDLRPHNLIPELLRTIGVLEEKKSTTFETIHRKKDGTLFPVEVSARLVEIEGTKYYNTIGRDITERKNAEETLRKSEGKYRELVENANSIIDRFDIDGRFTFVNEYFLKFFEFTEDEIIGKPVIGTILPESGVSGEDMTNLIKELFKDPDHYKTNVNENISKSGQRFWISWTNKPIFDKEGNIVEILAVGNDITKLKQAEMMISESEERFRKMFEESPISYAISDKNFRFVRANPSFCNMMGYQESEIANLSFRELTHTDYISKDEFGLNELVKGNIPVYNTEKRYVRKDNTLIWGSTTVSTLKDRGGQITYFMAMIEDITQKKEAQIKAEESHSLLKATLESTADGILVVDLSGKIVQFNRKFAEMWKIPEAILVSRDDDDALSFVRDQLKEPDSFLENVRHLYDSPISVSFDLLEFKDGRVFERYSQPQRINDKIVGRVWSFRDITLMKTAEYQLIKAKEKAEESDRLKTAFLHNISHEIRTPMNAIVGFTALLDDQELQAEIRRQYIDIINQSSNQLLSIITDIVDISNIETGQTRVTIHQVNINTMIRNLYEQYSIRAVQQGLTINFNLSLNYDEALLDTDGTKLFQILSNLLNNSLKFTIKGKIEFGYSLKNGWVEFMVSDTGIGISKDKQARIFERFYQVDNSTARQFSGTGLGLSICRAYAELLGGSIRVESEPGEGSTFYLTLPDKFRTKDNILKEREAEEVTGSFRGKTLLVAEDDDINYLVVEQTLKTENIELIRAVNGKEAVEICRLNSKIDLVLLDLKMPVMDGMEAMKLIKEFRPYLPFVALSAYAFDSDRKNAMEQGCVNYISKPYSKDGLLGVLRKHL